MTFLTIFLNIKIYDCRICPISRTVKLKKIEERIVSKIHHEHRHKLTVVTPMPWYIFNTTLGGLRGAFSGGCLWPKFHYIATTTTSSLLYETTTTVFYFRKTPANQLCFSWKMQCIEKTRILMYTDSHAQHTMHVPFTTDQLSRCSKCFPSCNLTKISELNRLIVSDRTLTWVEDRYSSVYPKQEDFYHNILLRLLCGLNISHSVVKVKVLHKWTVFYIFSLGFGGFN